MSVFRKIKTAGRLIHRTATRPTPESLVQMTYAVNNFCNNKCMMCNIWQVYRKDPTLLQNELSVNEVRRAFESSKYLQKIKFMLLTGGEPLLKEDFVEIYLFLVDFVPGIYIGIASNGRATSLILSRLREMRAGLDRSGQTGRQIRIGFSLDGYAELHDRVRGTPGLYDSVLRTIGELQRLPYVEMALSFTIGPHNYKDFLKVFQLARELKLGLAYRCVQTSPIYYGNENQRDGWEPEQLAELEEALRFVEGCSFAGQPAIRRLLNMVSYYNKMMIEYERNPRRLHECYSGTESVFLDSYGNVFPCIIRKGSLGNIRQAGFDAIWKSERGSEIRRSIALHECHCWVDCEVNAAMSREPRAYLHNLSRLTRR